MIRLYLKLNDLIRKLLKLAPAPTKTIDLIQATIRVTYLNAADGVTTKDGETYTGYYWDKYEIIGESLDTGLERAKYAAARDLRNGSIELASGELIPRERVISVDFLTEPCLMEVRA